MQPSLPTSTSSNGSPATSLPYELLLQIFLDTVPRLHEYDPSVSQGFRSSWLSKSLRTKKALPLVCRAWHAPATDILYSDIVLRRMGQVPALAEALRERSATDEFVVSLILSCPAHTMTLHRSAHQQHTQMLAIPTRPLGET